MNYIPQSAFPALDTAITCEEACAIIQEIYAPYRTYHHYPQEFEKFLKDVSSAATTVFAPCVEMWRQPVADDILGRFAYVSGTASKENNPDTGVDEKAVVELEKWHQLWRFLVVCWCSAAAFSLRRVDSLPAWHTYFTVPVRQHLTTKELNRLYSAALCCATADNAPLESEVPSTKLRLVGSTCALAIVCSSTLEQAWLATQVFYSRALDQALKDKSESILSHHALVDTLLMRIKAASSQELAALYKKVQSLQPNYPTECSPAAAEWFVDNWLRGKQFRVQEEDDNSVVVPEFLLSFRDMLFLEALVFRSEDWRFEWGAPIKTWTRMISFTNPLHHDQLPPVYSVVQRVLSASIAPYQSLHPSRASLSSAIGWCKRMKPKPGSRPSKQYLRMKISMFWRSFHHTQYLEYTLCKWRLLCIRGMCEDVALLILAYLCGHVSSPKNFFKRFTFLHSILQLH